MATTDSRVLHVIDAAGDEDPLGRAVLPARSGRLARRLDHPLLCWRAAAAIDALRPRMVVAWGDRAFAAARRSAAPRGLWRPCPWSPRIDALPEAGWHAVAATQSQVDRLRGAGWPPASIHVIAPPGTVCDGSPAPRRAELGIADEDFVWLLAGEPCRSAGLREAIWAGTLTHVAERGRRRHRLLLWGDAASHRRARTFVDQLGLPELCVATAAAPYESLAEPADAMLLLPTGPCGAWSAAVAAAAGLPVVAGERAELREILGDRPSVRYVSEARPRVVAQAMLRLARASNRGSGDSRFTADAAREAWAQLVARIMPG